MKRLLTILLLATSLSSYAVDTDLLKQSLVGMWHPSRRWDNDNPNDENQLNFYLEGDRLMVKYVADYSAIYDKDRAEYYNVFNEFGTCLVDVHYDGTIDFHVNRKMLRYDKKGREERIGGGNYTYHLFFVDGLLAGTETWKDRYEIMQSTDDRGICKYKTLAQAERRGETHAFPFGNEPYTTHIDFYNNDETNIKKFYKNGVINELSNCNPENCEFGFLLGIWGYNDDGLWNRYSNQAFNIKIFVRDGNYYVLYSVEDYALGIVQIYPIDRNGEVLFSFDTKQEFMGECEGYEWPWKYEFEYNVKKVNETRLVGTRKWTSVSGPIKVCDIPEPENCNVFYFKWKNSL